MANEKVGAQGMGDEVEAGRATGGNAPSWCGCHTRSRHVGDGLYTGVATVTQFKTGATRTAETSFDPEGFLNPAVLEAFSRYMERHRVQADGGLRASDNWQKGMPTSRTRRSLARHYLDVWLLYRGYPAHSADCGGVRDALCGVLFNTMLLLKNELDGNAHEEER